MSETITWKKLSKPWIPEKENDEISGKLVKIEKDVGENKSMFYTLETEDAIKGVWGSTVLDKQIEFFKLGDYVKIVFLGKKEGSKKESYKDFDVFKGVLND